MSDSFSLDTNLLIYSFDQTSPSVKQQRSKLLVDTAATHQQSLPLQCLNEFCHATRRKGLLTPVEVEVVSRALLKNFTFIAAVEADVTTALRIHANHGFSHWDSLLLATCLRSGVSVFFSEDLQDNFALGTLRIVNPFTRSETEINDMLGLPAQQ